MIGDIYERQLRWLGNVEKRLEKERKKESKDEVKGCTFRPDIKQSVFTFNNMIQKRKPSKKKQNLANIKNFLKIGRAHV